MITGEYLFSDEDEEIDVIKQSVEGNKLKIRWATEAESTFMNYPLLSDVGLVWLSSYRGQNLIEEIFDSLSSAAEMGKTNLKLDFSLTKDGWSFAVGSRKVYCCMPDELVEIIARENFTIDDTKSTQKSYAIKVSWYIGNRIKSYSCESYSQRWAYVVLVITGATIYNSQEDTQLLLASRTMVKSGCLHKL